MSASCRPPRWSSGSRRRSPDARVHAAARRHALGHDRRAPGAGRARPRGAVTVVQIDAHLDLRDDDSDYNEDDPSRYAHSCVMRRACELGFRDLLGRHPGVFARGAALRARPRPAGVRVGPRRGADLDGGAGGDRTERVYLTIDVDGFDPAVTPATGTPVPGGLAGPTARGCCARCFSPRRWSAPTSSRSRRSWARR